MHHADALVIGEHGTSSVFLWSSARICGSSVETLYSDPHNVEEVVRRADLVIGAVLIPGAVAPQLVTANLISQMEKGSVVVDVAFPTESAIDAAAEAA